MLNRSDEITPATDTRRVLLYHLAGVALQGTGVALVFILPFLARKRFDANNFHTWVLTAAVPMVQFFTIFWNHLYARISSRSYILFVTSMACVPIGIMAFATSIHLILVCYVISAFAGAGGGAALSPLNADLLRTCYSEGVRGRVFGMITAAHFVGLMGAGYGMGRWSDADPDAYRIFLPLSALLLAGGFVLFAAITETDRFRRRPRSPVPPGQPWWAPLRDMGAILRRDRHFAAYEIAFMSYGTGWMICTALVPLLANDKLNLDYAEFANATVVAWQVTMIVMLVPMGRLADRIGPVRLAAGSFLWLTIYPIGLLAAPSAVWLGGCTILYALGMVGVHLTWTLGPVAFAPEPERASHYLAIHGTLVGVRGMVVQGVGVGLYSLTGRFWPAMMLGALGFFWASRRMRRLAREMGRDATSDG